MAAASQTVPALLTLEEYLHTAYHPDCDFVDGHLEERNLGDIRHSLLQVEVAFWFRLRQHEWKIRVMSELRTRVSANRVRVPDVSVAYDDDAMKDRIRNVPSLIAIEILSPDDRLERVKVRLHDFLQMGITQIWLLDPAKRSAHTYAAGGLKLVEGTQITIPNSPIYLDLREIFTALD